MARRKLSIDDDALIRAGQVMADTAAPSLDLAREYAVLAAEYRKQQRKLHKTLTISDTYQSRLKETLKLLEDASAKYRQLKDVALPICMYCKKVRADNNYWQKVETYFGTHADIMFSHGICPDCIEAACSHMGVPLSAIKLPKAPPAANLSTRRGQEPVEDAALDEMRALFDRSMADGNPLAPELDRIISRYDKLLRRFTKTMSISDGYQSQLMDFKARLEVVARTDLLTGLSNRWEIMARLEAEQSRSNRYGTTFSLLICDLDFFKEINDTYGHSAGDKVLKAVADSLRLSLRNEDFCGRWGGEEFLILLPETGLTQAGVVAEKLLAAVRDVRVPWEERAISVTMSAGVGEFKTGMSIDQCIKQVDDALYSAKHSGRDRFLLVK
ncbi:MAG: diguanylate cyclase [Desulfuromonadaceae bacterium]|nr:diguanylate cyclase [Desulfuromonadaceae bacterium]MDD5106459.1 diguanylate cyclase [Desulfuromonadaceae bacterium]